MEVQIGKTGVLDANAEVSTDESMPLNDASTESENAGNDLAPYGIPLLDEVDSYMEDLNARLTVSRMVSDSVIKGFVNGIVKECDEKNSLKEEEVANLKKLLRNNDANAADEFQMDQLVRTQGNPIMSFIPSDASVITHVEHLKRLRIATGELLHKLKEEIGNEKISNLNRADALYVEIVQSSSYSNPSAVNTFHIVDECINSLETLLTEMRTCVGAIISSREILINEQLWENDTQIEISNSMLHNLIIDMHHECETKILDQKSLMSDLKHKWHIMSDELATLRLELDDISKSLLSWEPGLHFAHISHEIVEERNALKRKDEIHNKTMGNGTSSHEENTQIAMEKDEEYEKPINVDSPQLMCLSKEGLIGFFKTEMAKMKRQHDVALQERTEKYYSLKRAFLKKKGYSHLNFKKDKEFELMRRRLAETITKLDDILSKDVNLSPIRDDEDICGLKEKIDAILLENRHLAFLLAAKRKETSKFLSMVLETTNQFPNSSIGVELVDQMEKLNWDLEGLKFETTIKDVVNKSALRELSSELENKVEDMEMETKVDQSIYSFILREVVRDLTLSFNTVRMECYEEKDSFSENLLEKEKALCLEMEKNKMLKHHIESASTLLKMKEKQAAELEAALMHQNEQFDSVCHESDKLRDQAIEQDLVIAEINTQSDLIKCRLEKDFHDIHQYEAEINKINENLKIVSGALLEAGKQKSILQSELQENQERLASEMIKEKEKRKQMESILASMSELSKSFKEWELKITDVIEHNESRLKLLCIQSEDLTQLASLVKEKLLWYKQVFHRRCEDLKKAETEVDLLGDEADNLLSLLGKIYMALEHYSSVLQYYPGVMDILKLIRREMKGEASG